MAGDAGPDLVRPDRHGFEHDLFVVTAGGAGRSFRLRFGPDRAPQRSAASLPTVYDGIALARFGRLVLERDVDLAGGGAFHEARVRLWEEDGLGAGRWVHADGTFRRLPDDFGHDCDPQAETCRWEERSGTDLVSALGTLRGIRRWSGGYTGGDHGWSKVRYSVVDRFGREQDFLRLWGPQHKEMIREARGIWDAMPEDERSCYAFDYASSYPRATPGGLVWVMHGTARYDTCPSPAIPIEVPAEPPQYGGFDPSRLGEPGDRYHFGPPDVWVEPGPAVRVSTASHSVDLPGGGAGDPPLVAVHWMPSSAIPEAHVAPLELAFTEVHDLRIQAGPAPVVDGRLNDWADGELLLLDARANVAWLRADAAWDGATDASLAVGIREVDEGWVVAARAGDDVFAGAAEGRRTVATDHLELWLRVSEGWLQLAVLPGDQSGEARVEAWALAASGEQEGDVPASLAHAAKRLHAAAVRHDEGTADIDYEVFLPRDLARDDDGRTGLRILSCDSDGEHELQADLRMGNTAPLADAWLRTGNAP